ncbi:hypothetical protein Tco_0706969 [Tanacetum coccineum]|uniref:Uncharacterized protein n=1 Tax=Tanacetum coccineum TaxID=301880 RepID=A0ABQ4Y8X4_9ASTR
MLNTINETMILERPFLATIHAEIDFFNKEISLGIGDDSVTLDMDKKIHNFTTLVGKIYMVNSIHNDESSTSSNAPSDKSPQFEKSNNVHHENNKDNYMQERSNKKEKMLEPDTNTLSAHFCKPIKKNCNGILKVWPTCDPTKKLCNEGNEIYRMDEQRVLKYWYCCLHDDSKIIKGSGLSFPDFLLVRENCKKVQGDNTYCWHDHGLEENERQESDLDIQEYDPLEVHVETYEEEKRIKVQRNDPKRSGHGREGPKKDVECLESNLKTP